MTSFFMKMNERSSLCVIFMYPEKININSRRQLIIQSALNCFIRQGFHQTSMRDIAKEAKVSLGNLYNYFAGKDALIEEIAELDSVEQNELLATLCNSSPLTALQRFSEAYLEQLSQPDRTTLFVEVIAECTRNPKVALFFGKNEEIVISALTKTIKCGMDTGKIRQSISPDFLAKLILDGLEGFAVRKMLVANTQANSKALVQSLLTLIKIDDE